MNRVVIATLLLVWASTLFAADAHYLMRVDGLACPYCAYGVEKKLKQIDGVTSVDIDLDNGVVTVFVREGVSLSEPDMRKLFNEAGFTYRSMAIVSN
ncbi:MAG TPA: heavy-metal-associated domain-containing protein [Woeseiaceae bacterium]|nr:heavy-metal-associated domain-containing protein [Woeseiaceae bacterium]